MPVTQADVDKLNAAIASGARSVTLGEQTVIINTTESLIKARDDLLKQIQRQETAAKRRSRANYVVYDRGVD